MIVGDLLPIHEIASPKHEGNPSSHEVHSFLNDLNNYLVILNGHTADLLRLIPRSSPAYPPAGGVWTLAQKLAARTERLLMFFKGTSDAFCGAETVLVVDDEEGVLGSLPIACESVDTGCWKSPTA